MEISIEDVFLLSQIMDKILKQSQCNCDIRNQKSHLKARTECFFLMKSKINIYLDLSSYYSTIKIQIILFIIMF